MLIFEHFCQNLGKFHQAFDKFEQEIGDLGLFQLESLKLLFTHFVKELDVLDEPSVALIGLAIPALEQFHLEKVPFENDADDPENGLVLENPVLRVILQQFYFEGLSDLREEFQRELGLDIVLHMFDGLPDIFDQILDFE